MDILWYMGIWNGDGDEVRLLLGSYPAFQLVSNPSPITTPGAAISFDTSRIEALRFQEIFNIEFSLKSQVVELGALEFPQTEKFPSKKRFPWKTTISGCWRHICDTSCSFIRLYTTQYNKNVLIAWIFRVRLENNVFRFSAVSQIEKVHH